MKLTLITGGVRSGKSRFAEETAAQLAQQQKGNVLYVATGIKSDREMEQRILLHQKRRPVSWGLLESPYSLADSVKEYEPYEIILIDCLSTFLSNCLISESWTDSDIHKEVDKWLENIRFLNKQVMMVSSEAGLGGVAMSPLGRRFQDVLGELNQKVAREADQVYALFSGIPWRIKG